MEDNAFLWEEEPLRALTAQDILLEHAQDIQDVDQTNGEEEVKSPLGTFRRHPVIRKKRTPNGGFSANFLPHPTDVSCIQMSQASNFNAILNPHSPVIPELVHLDRSQQLHHVLPYVVPDQHPVTMQGPERLIE